VISGAGAAGVAIAKMLIEAGIGDVAVADRKGVVSRDRDDLTPIKAEVASFTNKTGISGTLEAALEGADVFVGVSGGTVAEPAVASMAKGDRKSTRLNSSHVKISYAVFCLKKKKSIL